MRIPWAIETSFLQVVVVSHLPLGVERAVFAITTVPLPALEDAAWQGIACGGYPVLSCFLPATPLEASLDMIPAFSHMGIVVLPPGTDVSLRDIAPQSDTHVDRAPSPDVVVETLSSGKIAAGRWKLSSSRPCGRGC